MSERETALKEDTRELLAALVGLVAATEAADNPSDEGLGSDDPAMQRARVAIARATEYAGQSVAALPGDAPQVCEWRELPMTSHVYQPECEAGNFDAARTAMDAEGWKFCPNCGKPLSLVAPSPAQETTEP